MKKDLLKDVESRLNSRSSEILSAFESSINFYLKKVQILSSEKSTSCTELKRELNSYVLESFNFLNEIQEKLDASLEINVGVQDFGNHVSSNEQEDFLIWQDDQFKKFIE